MSERKTPMRRCVGCGQMKIKADLTRIVRLYGGGYAIDPTGKRAGRGAYVCPKAVCVARATKHKGFERSYKSSFPKEIYALLSREVEHGEA